MQKFWLVWNEERTAPIFKHLSKVHAIEEASRLAVKQPGDKFYVLESCLTATMPVKIIEHDDEIL